MRLPPASPRFPRCPIVAFLKFPCSPRCLRFSIFPSSRQGRKALRAHSHARAPDTLQRLDSKLTHGKHPARFIKSRQQMNAWGTPRKFYKVPDASQRVGNTASFTNPRTHIGAREIPCNIYMVPSSHHCTGNAARTFYSSVTKPTRARYPARFINSIQQVSACKTSRMLDDVPQATHHLGSASKFYNVPISARCEYPPTPNITKSQTQIIARRKLRDICKFPKGALACRSARQTRQRPESKSTHGKYPAETSESRSEGARWK